MNHDVLQTAARLMADREPFALATVVRVEGSSSAPCGSKAIVDARGKLLCGWIGGGCAESAVRRAAREAIEVAEPRTITIDMTDELLGVGMPCGGVMDVFIEPVLARPDLLILGHGRIAEALAAMGAVLRFRVTVTDPSAERSAFPAAERVLTSDLDLSQSAIGPDTWVVIATQHKGDHLLLRRALASGAPYVALIASRHRAALVLEDVEDSSRVHTPAGLEIGAATPEEIALSVLSEIVAVRRGVAATKLTQKVFLPIVVRSCDR
jgi:xanthine dehydrogenase accessory factor